MIRAGELNRKIRIQRPVADESFDGAGSSTWEDLTENEAPLFASVQDSLPSRGERLADGLNIATRPARVRIRWRTDVRANMRVLIGETVDGTWQTYRTAQIVTPPAELGFRKGLEFMIEDYSTAGNG